MRFSVKLVTKQAPVTPRWATWKFENQFRRSERFQSNVGSWLKVFGYRFGLTKWVIFVKNTIFHDFSIHFYRKHSKNTCNVLRTPCTPLRGPIFRLQLSIGILGLWLKALRGAFSSTLKWHDSQTCGSDRFRVDTLSLTKVGIKWLDVWPLTKISAY